MALQTAFSNKNSLDQNFYFNNLFRIYTQLFKIYQQTNQLDSLKLYNQKVGEIYQILNNDKVSRFYYRQKATIYTEERQLDSAIFTLKNLKHWIKRVTPKPT